MTSAALGPALERANFVLFHNGRKGSSPASVRVCDLREIVDAAMASRRIAELEAALAARTKVIAALEKRAALADLVPAIAAELEQANAQIAELTDRAALARRLLAP